MRTKRKTCTHLQLWAENGTSLRASSRSSSCLRASASLHIANELANHTAEK
jgi:hypothetical protein